MKQINIVCYDNGKAKITTSDININNENEATEIVIDFSGTLYASENKFLDIVLSNGTSLRYDLGIEPIVTKELLYPDTVAGEMILTPFVYDGVRKIKYRPDFTIIIYEQKEAGDSAAIVRDDYIFALKEQVEEHEERITALEQSNRAYVFAYITEPSNTTCVLANTYYPIIGTFNNEVVNGFGPATIADFGIKYLQEKTKLFEIDFHATINVSATGTTVHMAIFKNGFLVEGSIMGNFIKVIGEAQIISGTCVVSLETDDEIELVLMADGAGDTVTVVHYTTTIREF